MAKIKNWLVNIDGKEYNITSTIKQFTSKCFLKINDEELILKRTFLHTITGMDDHVINLGEKECNYVVVGKNADLAVDGYYLDSKKPYVSIKNMSWWYWIFIALCILIPIVSLGGALPVILGFGGASLCTRIAVSFYKPYLKVLLSSGTVVLSWGLFIFVLSLLS